MRPEDRRAHTYIVGKTGTGKSSLLKNIIEQDLAAGRGVALIDPHGDLAESLLDAIPRHRFGDVTYFNAGDTEFPVAWNILSIAAGDNPALIASGVVAALQGHLARLLGAATGVPAVRSGCVALGARCYALAVQYMGSRLSISRSLVVGSWL